MVEASTGWKLLLHHEKDGSETPFTLDVYEQYTVRGNEVLELRAKLLLTVEDVQKINRSFVKILKEEGAEVASVTKLADCKKTC